jgi:hypothetical protein
MSRGTFAPGADDSTPVLCTGASIACSAVKVVAWVRCTIRGSEGESDIVSENKCDLSTQLPSASAVRPDRIIVSSSQQIHWLIADLYEAS